MRGKYSIIIIFLILVMVSVSLPVQAGKLTAGVGDLAKEIVSSLNDTGRYRVMILDFDEVGGKPSALGRFLAEELTVRLFKTKKLEVADRQLLGKVLYENRTSLGNLLETTSTRDLGRMLGVNALIMGTYADLGAAVAINIRLINTETGGIISVAGVEIAKDEGIKQLLEQKLPNVQEKPKAVQDRPREDRKGWKGEYFNNPDLSDLKLVRFDPTINFDWGAQPPAPAIEPDTYSVRWTGKIKPGFSEIYTFCTITDDGVRLWVDGQLLINRWIELSSMENRADLYLRSGNEYEVRMEYYENGGWAKAILLWSSPSQPREVL